MFDYPEQYAAPAPPPPPPKPPAANLTGDIGNQLGSLQNQWGQFGINQNLGGVNISDALRDLLRSNQIEDLSKLKLSKKREDQYNEDWGWQSVDRPIFQYGDRQFYNLQGTPFGGQQYSNALSLGSVLGKDGWTSYQAFFDDQGNLTTIVPEWTEEGSALSHLLPVLSIAAMPFAGPLAGALGGGLSGTIGANALIQGGLGGLASAAQGGDFLEGALKGGATGAFTAGIGSVVNPIASSIGADVLNATDSKFLSDIVSGAVKGVPKALLAGDASNLLTNAVTGAVGSQVGDQLGLSPGQVQAGIGLASRLLQDDKIGPADLIKIVGSLGSSMAPASSPAPADSSVDVNALMAFLGDASQSEAKPNPYQVAQTNTPSPFGTVFDQQQDLLGLMERG